MAFTVSLNFKILQEFLGGLRTPGSCFAALTGGFLCAVPS